MIIFNQAPETLVIAWPSLRVGMMFVQSELLPSFWGELSQNFLSKNCCRPSEEIFWDRIKWELLPSFWGTKTLSLREKGQNCRPGGLGTFCANEVFYLLGQFISFQLNVGENLSVYVVFKAFDNGRKLVVTMYHEPPVENSRLLDPEEWLDGPGEAVLVPQLRHQGARHLVNVSQWWWWWWWWWRWW